MEQETIRFRFTHVPKNEMDVRTLGYLQVTAPRLPVLRERVWLALSSYWLPHAVQAAGGDLQAVWKAAHAANRQNQQHRQFVEALCGLAPEYEPVDLQLPEPYLDRDLKIPGALPKPPQRFQIAAEEVVGSQYGQLAAYFNGLTRRERLMPVLRPLRIFWYPLACRYVGVRGEKLKRVGRTTLAALESQERHLQVVFSLQGRMPVSVASPKPSRDCPEEDQFF